MNDKSRNFCVILAGGKGLRLWPVSREAYPKQFVDIFGVGRTQLQQTFDRMLKLIPLENIFVSTYRAYTQLVEEQLPELPKQNILSEPIYRNTAPSTAWACYRVRHICKDANLVVIPSDQAVINEEAFLANIKEGFDFVDHNSGLLTLGVSPTRPEPGYGYIQLGEETEVAGLYRVKSFTEKPYREFARMFIQSDEFLWNTGCFMANVEYLIHTLNKILPSVMRVIDNDDVNLSLEEELAYVNENFPRYPNLSIDYGILEKAENVFVKLCNFGWADLGTWHSIYEAESTSQDDNVIIDSEVIIDDSHNNIVKIPKDHIAVLNGLEGFIVAEKGNVLLICKKEDSSALIRKYVNEVGMKYGDEFV